MSNLKKISELTESLNRVEKNLREEKAILEFVIEHTTDGYWDWHIPSNYEYLSPRFKSQLGYSELEMENKPDAWMVICNKEDLDRAYGEIQKVLSGEKDDFKDTLRFTHKDGHEVKVICRGKLVERDEDGSPVRMIGTHTIID